MIHKISEDEKVTSKLTMEVSPEEIIRAVQNMSPEDQEDFIEQLLAATSSEYLQSVREAREDYKAGRVESHDDLFSE